METKSEFKSFYRDKTMEELNYDIKIWKKQIEFLQHDFDFLKNVLDSNIYNSGIINLFENLQLHKTKIEDLSKEASIILDKFISHEEHLQIYLECDDINFDYFFIETHAKIEYDFVAFLQKSNNIKQQLFEYIQSVIIK